MIYIYTFRTAENVENRLYLSPECAITAITTLENGVDFKNGYPMFLHHVFVEASNSIKEPLGGFIHFHTSPESVVSDS